MLRRFRRLDRLLPCRSAPHTEVAPTRKTLPFVASLIALMLGVWVARAEDAGVGSRPLALRRHVRVSPSQSPAQDLAKADRKPKLIRPVAVVRVAEDRDPAQGADQAGRTRPAKSERQPTLIPVQPALVIQRQSSARPPVPAPARSGPSPTLARRSAPRLELPVETRLISQTSAEVPLSNEEEPVESPAIQPPANLPAPLSEAPVPAPTPIPTPAPVETREPELAHERPPTVRNFERSQLWNMELGEALLIALRNNPYIAVQHFESDILGTRVETEFSRFDPRLEANHHLSVTQNRVASTVDTFGTGTDLERHNLYGSATGNPDQIGISKQLMTGGSLTAGISTGVDESVPAGAFNALNPVWRSGASVEFVQPLARGRGRAIQTIPIQVARALQESTEFEFQSTLLNLMRDVEITYWNLVYAHQSLEVGRRDLEAAAATYRKEVKRFSLGESSRPEVGEAKLFYYRQLEVYQIRKSELLEFERSFRAILGLQGFDDVRIFAQLPEDLPRIDSDWSRSLATMLERRPDLIAQRINEESAAMQYQLAANQGLPDLNFEATLNKTGLSDDFSDSFGRIVSDNNYTWLLGLSYSRDVNRHAARAEQRRARLTWAQQKATTRNLEHNATHSLQQAYQAVHLRKDRVELTRDLYDAALERYTAYHEKFELGDLEIDLYLRARAELSDAELKRRFAQIDLLKAMTEFEYVRGTLMDARSVIFADQPPQLVQAESADSEDLSIPEGSVQPPPFRAPDFSELMERAPQLEQ